MFNLSARSKLCLAAAMILLLYPGIAANGESLRYSLVLRDIVEARLMKYGGDNKQREATLKQMFAEVGCDDQHLSEQRVTLSKLPNVICTLPGGSDKVIIVGAHFDRTPEGNGVVDNWSGASLLPSLYEAVKNEPRKHTYIFIGFTDEEKGEVGSRFYVRQMSKQQVAATDAMVNLDTLGLAPTEIWASHSDKRLIGALLALAKQLDMPVTGVNVEQVGSSDGEQFAERKIPRITIHSLTQVTWDARILHTAKDKPSAIRLDDYYQTYHLLAAYVAFLDQFANAAATSKPL
ncbi:MAG TPA: M28 family peptidase [Terriglobales bacterium]|jgi:putative aminopeptidase FrvX|nr:M28 family peptidase [Terriglobales bacterium]